MRPEMRNAFCARCSFLHCKKLVQNILGAHPPESPLPLDLPTFLDLVQGLILMNIGFMFVGVVGLGEWLVWLHSIANLVHQNTS